MLNFIDEFSTVSDVLVPQIGYVLRDSHCLITLRLQVDFCRNRHIRRVVPNLHSLAQCIVLDEELLFQATDLLFVVPLQIVALIYAVFFEHLLLFHLLQDLPSLVELGCRFEASPLVRHRVNLSRHLVAYLSSTVQVTISHALIHRALQLQE